MKFLTTFVILAFFVTSCGEGENQTNKIRIATWNIYWLADHGFNTRTQEHYNQLNQYVQDLDAQIIALQEVENADYARLVLGDAYDFYFSQRPGGRGTQRVGIAVRKNAGISVVSVEDVTALDVGSVRYGVEAVIQKNGRSLRILALHLKSGCFEEPLDANNLSNLSGNLLNSCTKLELQRSVLENWVDTRAYQELPFIILGDFNRRFAAELSPPPYDEEQGFWPAIDDPEIDPAEDLSHLDEGKTPNCWSGRFQQFIDHIVVDPRALELYEPNSFGEQVFLETDYANFYRVLSDHCAIFADFTL